MRSKKITLILNNGTPYGIRTAELSNWNGKVIICPQTSLKELKNLEETNNAAVYFLVGPDNQIYVGETDILGKRLSHHALTKDFWNEVIAFTSPKLGKTEVKYLESVFTQRLKDDKRAQLENNTIPLPPNMTAEDQDAMDEFVDRASDVLLSLGCTFIAESEEVEQSAKQGIKVYCQGPEAKASGLYSENGIMVLTGSQARKELTPTISKGYAKLHQDLIDSGILVDDDRQSLKFTEDYLFPALSPAAAVVLGRSANGWLEWKTADGESIKQLEQES